MAEARDVVPLGWRRLYRMPSTSVYDVLRIDSKQTNIARDRKKEYHHHHHITTTTAATTTSSTKVTMSGPVPMIHYPKAQTVKPPLIANDNAFLGDVSSS